MSFVSCYSTGHSSRDDATKGGGKNGKTKQGLLDLWTGGSFTVQNTQDQV